MQTARYTTTGHHPIDVEVSTTRFLAEDDALFGMAILKLTCGSMGWQLVMEDDRNFAKVMMEDPCSVELTVQGGREAKALLQGLEWATQQLRTLAREDGK